MFFIKEKNVIKKIYAIKDFCEKSDFADCTIIEQEHVDEGIYIYFCLYVKFVNLCLKRKFNVNLKNFDCFCIHFIKGNNNFLVECLKEDGRSVFSQDGLNSSDIYYVLTVLEKALLNCC